MSARGERERGGDTVPILRLYARNLEGAVELKLELVICFGIRFELALRFEIEGCLA